MVKYLNNNLSDLFAHLETKISSERVDFLRKTIEKDSFEFYITTTGEECKSLVIHKPSNRSWKIPDHYVDGKWVVSYVTDSPYILQSCLENMMTPEELNFANKWETGIQMAQQRIRSEDHILKTAKICSRSEWDGPVFDDGDFYNSFDDYIEYNLDNIDCEDDGFDTFKDNFPQFVSTSRFRFTLRDIDIDSLLIESFEIEDDIIDDIVGFNELQDAYNEFLNKNKEVGLYYQNNQNIIMLDEKYLREIWEKYNYE